MALTADITARIDAVQTGPNDFGSQTFRPQAVLQSRITEGTGVGQANIIFADQRTVASASNDDIDLAGVLTDAFGATVTAVELVSLMVINAPISGAANTTNLTIGGGSNPVVGFLGGTTPTIGPIGPGGVVMLHCPSAAGLGAVTASTGDILRIANSSGAPATYQMVVIARNA
jgi:hypothetical protein